MKYDEILLKDLVDIYEKRDANSSNFRTKIKIVLKKEKYPKYFSDISGFDEAIEDLKDKGFINVKYLKYDNVIESVSLNIEKMDAIYEFLNIDDSVKEKRDRLLNELSLYDDKILVDIKKYIEMRILLGESIKKFLNPDYLDAFKAIHYMENLNHDVYERNASNFIFNDSKRLKKLESIIISLYGDEDIFLKKGIISIPPLMYFKGKGIIKINEQVIDLNKVGNVIALPVEDINAISFTDIKKVTTIENLTTFYDYKDEGLIIYLGGFPTKNQLNILKKLYNDNINFYHFGDIDYGGFTILNYLFENISPKIKTINMDLETIKSNIKYCLEITNREYLVKLHNLLEKEYLKDYYDVITYLIDNKVRLEQESFYNN